MAAVNRSYCEDHVAQMEKRRKRIRREKEITMSTKKTMATAKERRISASDGTDNEPSESESERILVSQLKKGKRLVRDRDKEEAKSRKSVKSDEEEGNSTEKVSISLQFNHFCCRILENICVRNVQLWLSLG